ncbi:MAG: hypothetical protein RIR18_1209 [Pseudomonadota bacterium]|jgi:2-C-methyl-D-erythritol 4-phosphate cytidylyltransferase
MNFNICEKYHVIVPAAGSGSRFGAALPKQYLPLLGKPLLVHTLAALCDHPKITSVSVVLSPDDELCASVGDLFRSDKLTYLYCGGASRADSVRNGLAALKERSVAEQDWVLVHDAARPCLSLEMLNRLIDTLADDPVGGLLAIPVADTLKRADADNRVAETLPREGLWQAQTPQMFRFGLLCDALDRFPSVTDEAGAIEAAGFQPKLVAGELSNLKVTYQGDLPLAEAILLSRRNP